MPFDIAELRIRLDRLDVCSTLVARLPPCSTLGGKHGTGAKETFEAAKRLAAFWPVNTIRTWLPVRAARERALVLSRDARHLIA